MADPAERVVISVFEGDVYEEPDNSENVKLAEIPWEFHPPRPQKDGALEVMFEYGDDGILTVQIQDLFNSQKKRFAIQQAGADQMDAGQIMKMKRINEDLMQRSEAVENTPEFRDAIEVLKKTEQDVIPKVEDQNDRRELEDLCREVREAMASGDKKKMEDSQRRLERSAVKFRVSALIHRSRSLVDALQ